VRRGDQDINSSPVQLSPHGSRHTVGNDTLLAPSPSPWPRSFRESQARGSSSAVFYHHLTRVSSGVDDCIVVESEQRSRWAVTSRCIPRLHLLNPAVRSYTTTFLSSSSQKTLLCHPTPSDSPTTPQKQSNQRPPIMSLSVELETPTSGKYTQPTGL
jgi:hypothetical protein